MCKSKLMMAFFTLFCSSFLILFLGGCDLFDALARSGNTTTTISDSSDDISTTTTTLLDGTTTTSNGTGTTKPGATSTTLAGGTTTTILPTTTIPTTTTTTLKDVTGIPDEWSGTYTYSYGGYSVSVVITSDKVTLFINDKEIMQFRDDFKFYLDTDYNSYCFATAVIPYTYDKKDYEGEVKIKFKLRSDGDIDYSISINGTDFVNSVVLINSIKK